MSPQKNIQKFDNIKLTPKKTNLSNKNGPPNMAGFSHLIPPSQNWHLTRPPALGNARSQPRSGPSRPPFCSKKWPSATGTSTTDGHELDFSVFWKANFLSVQIWNSERNSWVFSHSSFWILSVIEENQTSRQQNFPELQENEPPTVQLALLKKNPNKCLLRQQCFPIHHQKHTFLGLWNLNWSYQTSSPADSKTHVTALRPEFCCYFASGTRPKTYWLGLTKWDVGWDIWFCVG